MTVTLLAPWALAAAGLLAIPVVLHLFKPRRVRRTPFSSLRWLELTPQKLSRRVQWHQVLLFLLRAAFVSLLVLALAKPLLTAAGADRFRERFVVVDVSHSMGYRAAGQAPPVERARALAAELVRRNQPGDRTAVLLTGSQTRLLTPLSREPQSYLPALERVEAGQSETDLATALPVIRGLLGRPREGAAAEVWFFTDDQQHAWRPGAAAALLDGLAVPLSVRVVDVGVPGPQNAWVTRARLLTLDRPARRVVRVEVACVGDSTQERTVRLETPGLPERSQSVMLAPGRPAVVDIDLPADTELKTGILRVRLEPADALPGDDEFLVNLDAEAALRVLLVEGPAAGADPLPAGFHLRTALEALADVGQALRLTTRAAVEVRPEEFRDADVVLLADVPELTEAGLTALEERVRGGAGVAIVLGGAGKPAFLNERLYRPTQPGEGLLPAPVAPVDDVPDRLAPLTGVRWSHPLLAGLGDPLVGDLALARFRRWHRFTAPLADGSAVLARIDDSEPALVERAVGAGRVLVLNTGANDRWSDVARRKSFVPLVDRVLGQLSAAGVRRTFVAGEAVTVPLTAWQDGEAVSVITPSGRRLAPVVRRLDADRGLATFDAEEAGVYHVERPGGGAPGFPVVVQVGRGDSALAPMEAAVLKQWWAPAGCEVLRGDDLVSHLDAAAGRHAAWPWLLLTAGLVLLAETYLAHRVCPRANPKLAPAIVGRRTLVRHAASEG